MQQELGPNHLENEAELRRQYAVERAVVRASLVESFVERSLPLSVREEAIKLEKADHADLHTKRLKAILKNQFTNFALKEGADLDEYTLTLIGQSLLLSGRFHDLSQWQDGKRPHHIQKGALAAFGFIDQLKETIDTDIAEVEKGKGTVFINGTLHESLDVLMERANRKDLLKGKKRTLKTISSKLTAHTELSPEERIYLADFLGDWMVIKDFMDTDRELRLEDPEFYKALETLYRYDGYLEIFRLAHSNVKISNIEYEADVRITEGDALQYHDDGIMRKDEYGNSYIRHIPVTRRETFITTINADEKPFKYRTTDLDRLAYLTGTIALNHDNIEGLIQNGPKQLHLHDMLDHLRNHAYFESNGYAFLEHIKNTLISIRFHLIPDTIDYLPGFDEGIMYDLCRIFTLADSLEMVGIPEGEVGDSIYSLMRTIETGDKRFTPPMSFLTALTQEQRDEMEHTGETEYAYRSRISSISQNRDSFSRLLYENIHLPFEKLSKNPSALFLYLRSAVNRTMAVYELAEAMYEGEDAIAQYVSNKLGKAKQNDLELRYRILKKPVEELEAEYEVEHVLVEGKLTQLLNKQLRALGETPAEQQNTLREAYHNLFEPMKMELMTKLYSFAEAVGLPLELEGLEGQAAMREAIQQLELHLKRTGFVTDIKLPYILIKMLELDRV